MSNPSPLYGPSSCRINNVQGARGPTGPTGATGAGSTGPTGPGGGGGGNPDRVNAFSNNAQTVVSNALVVLENDPVISGMAFDTTTGIATIATAGTYLAAYGIAVVQGVTDANFGLLVNGATTPDQTFTSTNLAGNQDSVIRVSNTSLLQLGVGDTVAITNVGVDAALSGFGNPSAWLTLVKVG